ncbi:fatty acid desaturase [Actinokineospora soli]|uniref:Fatty acid desaturase n=1 Tax=Actinokineospora soli TaxID=1048753 RepID=A0ABW2TJD5_9PSEU
MSLVDDRPVAAVPVESSHLEFDFSRIDPAVRKRLRPLSKLDNWHAPLGVLQDYAVIAFAVWLSLGVSWWLFPVSAVLIGSTQRAFANILHDSAHKTLTTNQKLNLALGTVFSGYLILHLYNPYRSTHIGGHHRYLGDPELDPDYEFHIDAGIYNYRESNAKFFARNILQAVLGLRTVEYLRYIARDRIFVKTGPTAVSSPISMRTERIALFTQWALIIGAAATFGWLHYLLLFWFVPMFTTGVMVGWISELAEHYPLPESENKQVLMTRNRHGWAVENFIFGRHHDHYHLVHHLSMGIPFWNMKRAHEILLDDDAYAAWDRLWGGIFTRGRGRKGTETMTSYSGKYRAWRRSGGDPKQSSTTFAEVLTLAAQVRAEEARESAVSR